MVQSQLYPSQCGSSNSSGKLRHDAIDSFRTFYIKKNLQNLRSLHCYPHHEHAIFEDVVSFAVQANKVAFKVAYQRLQAVVLTL